VYLAISSSSFLRFIPFDSKPSSNNLHDKWNKVKNHTFAFECSDVWLMKMQNAGRYKHMGTFECDVRKASETFA
jgi:hypothetical protein